MVVDPTVGAAVAPRAAAVGLRETGGTEVRPTATAGAGVAVATRTTVPRAVSSDATMHAGASSGADSKTSMVKAFLDRRAPRPEDLLNIKPPFPCHGYYPDRVTETDKP